MTPQIPRPQSPVGFQSTAAPCKQSPSLIMKERHHFGNFYLLLSLLLLSVCFVSSEQSEHPDSARDMSYEKKKCLGISIFLGTFACKHLPVCAIWLLPAANSFRSILMNPGTSSALAVVLCLSPEQGEGWERGVALADAGKWL